MQSAWKFPSVAGTGPLRKLQGSLSATNLNLIQIKKLRTKVRRLRAAHSRACSRRPVMSAIGGKADIAWRDPDVRFDPKRTWIADRFEWLVTHYLQALWLIKTIFCP